MLAYFTAASSGALCFTVPPLSKGLVINLEASVEVSGSSVSAVTSQASTFNIAVIAEVLRKAPRKHTIYRQRRKGPGEGRRRYDGGGHSFQRARSWCIGRN